MTNLEIKNITYKTIRATRWVFVNGEDVGTIEPTLPPAGKWAFIPSNGYSLISSEPFREIIFGRTISDVKSKLNASIRRI